MNYGNLGYMTCEQWSGLDEENLTWYLSVVILSTFQHVGQPAKLSSVVGGRLQDMDSRSES